MKNSRGNLRAATVLTAVALQCQIAFPANSPKFYDLGKVEGMDHFGGSTQAKTLLATNGFVVADPFFKQIFEPYIKSKLPLFITTDSAWHTYHVLLEEGVKKLEEVQSRRLMRFSRLLLSETKNLAANGDADCAVLAGFVSVGLAFQDAQHRELLTGAEKSAIEILKSGVGEVKTPIGFPLSAVNFRAASFYTQSPVLSDYFAARQWYASVVFRLQDARETRLAFKLAWLINSHRDASNLWHQLSVPFDYLLAKSEDGDVQSYAGTAQKLFGNNSTTAPSAEQIADAQKELDARLSAPRISDQLLSPDEYACFGKVIKGFRLLSPRQLPCSVTFHQTTDPAIPKRMFPSGLDFLVASPTLRSPAAIRALEFQSGKEVAAAVLKLNCEPFPDSLYGESMKLLALLQRPVSEKSPPPLRTEAWADSQLWTQLGAWSEQRHTWALHTKLTVNYMGMTDTPPGTVAPYPEFFVGLASLAGRTADAFDRAGMIEPFDARAAAAEMVSQIARYRELRSPESRSRRRAKDDWMAEMEKTAQFQQVLNEQLEKRTSEFRGIDAYRKAEEKVVTELEEMAKRVAERGQASDDDTKILKQFASAGETKVPGLLREFATTCERLQKLAGKTAAGTQLNEDDSQWIRFYGTTLARFHFYEGNSYLTPLDNYPIVTRVYSHPLLNKVFYAGLGRPQALYVVVPDGEKLRLYQGAVMTYREFTRDAGEPLDDESWREVVFKGLAPSPPTFTRSFHAEADAKELIRIIRNMPRQKDFEGDYEPNPQIEQAAQLLLTRATAADLPDLFTLLQNVKPGDDDLAELLAQTISRLATTNDVPKFIALLTGIQARSFGWPDDVLPALARAISETPWQSHQALLVCLLGNEKPDVAAAAAHILGSKPDAIDTSALTENFNNQPPRARRLYCKLLGKTIERAGAKSTLLRAVKDGGDDVRWQAVSAIYAATWKDSNSVAALVSRLADTNHCVRFGAAFALGKFGATEAAPALLESLIAARQAEELADEEWDRQVKAVSTRDTESSRWDHEPDELPSFFADSRVRKNLRRADLLWILRPGTPRLARMMDFTFESAIIAALKELKYAPAADVLLEEVGGDNHSVAVEALKQIDPTRLEEKLFSVALNAQAEGTKRALALNGISELDAGKRVRDLLPLLDSTETIVLIPRRPGSDWRLCDHAAVVMAKLLGWEVRPQIMIDAPQREELIQKLRDWTKSQP